MVNKNIQLQNQSNDNLFPRTKASLLVEDDGITTFIANKEYDRILGTWQLKNYIDLNNFLVLTTGRKITLDITFKVLGIAHLYPMVYSSLEIDTDANTLTYKNASVSKISDDCDSLIFDKNSFSRVSSKTALIFFEWLEKNAIKISDKPNVVDTALPKNGITILNENLYASTPVNEVYHYNKDLIGTWTLKNYFYLPSIEKTTTINIKFKTYYYGKELICDKIKFIKSDPSNSGDIIYISGNNEYNLSKNNRDLVKKSPGLRHIIIEADHACNDIPTFYFWLVSQAIRVSTATRDPATLKSYIYYANTNKNVVGTGQDFIEEVNKKINIFSSINGILKPTHSAINRHYNWYEHWWTWTFEHVSAENCYYGTLALKQDIKKLKSLIFTLGSKIGVCKVPFDSAGNPQPSIISRTVRGGTIEISIKDDFGNSSQVQQILLPVVRAGSINKEKLNNTIFTFDAVALSKNIDNPSNIIIKFTPKELLPEENDIPDTARAETPGLNIYEICAEGDALVWDNTAFKQIITDTEFNPIRTVVKDQAKKIEYLQHKATIANLDISQLEDKLHTLGNTFIGTFDNLPPASSKFKNIIANDGQRLYQCVNSGTGDTVDCSFMGIRGNGRLDNFESTPKDHFTDYPQYIKKSFLEVSDVDGVFSNETGGLKISGHITFKYVGSSPVNSLTFHFRPYNHELNSHASIKYTIKGIEKPAIELDTETDTEIIIDLSAGFTTNDIITLTSSYKNMPDTFIYGEQRIVLTDFTIDFGSSNYNWVPLTHLPKEIITQSSEQAQFKNLILRANAYNVISTVEVTPEHPIGLWTLNSVLNLQDFTSFDMAIRFPNSSTYPTSFPIVYVRDGKFHIEDSLSTIFKDIYDNGTWADGGYNDYKLMEIVSLAGNETLAETLADENIIKFLRLNATPMKKQVVGVSNKKIRLGDPSLETEILGTSTKIKKLVADDILGELQSTSGRLQSPNFEHTFNNERIAMKLDICTGSMDNSGFKPSGDGFLHTYKWDNGGLWDTQLFIPNNTNHLQIRTRSGGAWKNDWKSIAYMEDLDNIEPSFGSWTISENSYGDLEFKKK